MKLKEQHIYGSSGLGMKNCDREIIGAQAVSDVGTFALVRGEKSYELSNHLGNVLEVITDQKFAISDVGSGIDHFLAEVISYTDYYPFGAPMDHGSASTDRNWQGDYRYGFNGMEHEPLVNTGEYDFGARMYDGRLGRWWSVDRMQRKYSAFSPYMSNGNNPIFFIDIDGRDIIDWAALAKSTYGIAQKICSQSDVFMRIVSQFQNTNQTTVYINSGDGKSYVNGSLKEVKLQFETKVVSDKGESISRGRTTLSFDETKSLDELTIADFTIVVNFNPEGLDNDDNSVQLITMIHEVGLHLESFSLLLKQFKAGSITAEELISKANEVASLDHSALSKKGAASVFEQVSKDVELKISNFKNTEFNAVPTNIDTSQRKGDVEFSWMTEPDVIEKIATYKALTGKDLMEDQQFTSSKGIFQSLTTKFQENRATHDAHYKGKD